MKEGVAVRLLTLYLNARAQLFASLSPSPANTLLRLYYLFSSIAYSIFSSTKNVKKIKKIMFGFVKVCSQIINSKIQFHEL